MTCPVLFSVKNKRILSLYRLLKFRAKHFKIKCPYLHAIGWNFDTIKTDQTQVRIHNKSPQN